MIILCREGWTEFGEKREAKDPGITLLGGLYLSSPSSDNYTASLSLRCYAEMRQWSLLRPILLSKTARPGYTIEDCPLFPPGTLCTGALGRRWGRVLMVQEAGQ